MKITKAWLLKREACKEGIEWFDRQKNTDEFAIIKKLIKDQHFDWANWYISRRLTKKKRMHYAINAAKLVLDLYEEKYPGDERPRMAIDLTEEYLKNPSVKNRKALIAAYDAAADDVKTADAAKAAYYAANVATFYAIDPTDAAMAAQYASYYAVFYADKASHAKRIEDKIIKYGVNLIKEKQGPPK